MTATVAILSRMHIIPLQEGIKLGAYQLESVYSLDWCYCIYTALDRSCGKNVLVQELSPAGIAVRNEDGGHLRALPGKDAEWEKILERFLKFYGRATGFSHMSLGKVLGAYRVLGSGIAVHEMPEGIPLSLNVKEGVKLLGEASPDSVERMMLNLLQAVAYLHERNILHGNISLDSIVVDAARLAMVIHGMRCLLERKGGKQVTLVHNTNVAAPEVLLAEGIYDSRAEVYSLAACFYFLLIGKPLLRGDQRFYSNHQTNLSASSKFLEKYSFPFLKSLDQALLPQRKARFASASAWLDYLEQ